MPSSKEERAENDVPKEGLCRHQKRNVQKMMSPKRVYAVIKRGAYRK
ncbi:hypothetical protein ACOJQI_02525 [Bacillus salacetis]